MLNNFENAIKNNSKSIEKAITFSRFVEVTGLIAAFFTFYAKISQEISNVIVYVSFVIIIILFFAKDFYMSLKLEWLINEKSDLKAQIESDLTKKHTDIYKDLSLTLGKVHELDRLESIGNSERSDLESLENSYSGGFTDFCTNVAKVLEKITGEQCAVCIKIVTDQKGLFTSSRDEVSAKTRNQSPEEETKHDIMASSSFKRILEKSNNNYYFNNNLVNDLDYTNTSFEFYSPAPLEIIDKIPIYIKEIEEREKLWYLPYKSSIVVPIIPSSDKKYKLLHRRNGDEFDEDIKGFLCIDSIKTDVFIEDRDVAILFGMADALYSPMRKFRRMIQFPDGNNNS